MNAPKLLRALGLAAAVVFVLGVTRLFQLRFESGDVYPPYSSLRADPLGARALFESLERLGGVTTRRNYAPLAKLAPTPRQAVVILGVDPWFWRDLTREEVAGLEALAARGDRLVITLRPVTEKPRRPRPAPAAAPAKRGERARPAEHGERGEGLTNRWGFALRFQDLPAAALTNAGPWHTLAYFGDLGSRWRTLAWFHEQPVVIERPFGAGSLVLCADSYFVSNEALRDDRHTELLARLVGAAPVVVFDETHLGVREAPGVMTLARRYRLHGLFAALAALAALFVWKNAVPFVPPYPDAPAAAAGKDAAAGLVNLLRRSIPPGQLLAVCFAEWKKSAGHPGRARPQQLAQAEAIVREEAARPVRHRDPVAAYRRIVDLLARR